MSGITVILPELAFAFYSFVVAVSVSLGRLGDPDTRLAGLSDEKKSVLTEFLGDQWDEVLAIELAVARNAAVGHSSVEGGQHFDAPRPVVW